jgi:uncharacterized protein YdcH (DUF465 family)
MMNKPVTDKLERLNVAKNKIEDAIEEYEVQLQKRREQITNMKQAQIQLEAEANSLVGSISALRKVMIDEEETNDE